MINLLSTQLNQPYLYFYKYSKITRDYNNKCNAN